VNQAFKNVPGYAEASRKQSAIRDAVWLDTAPVIAGIQCDALTVRKFAMLSEGQSPFVCGGPIFPEHVAQFLWVMSQDFCLDLAKRDEFVKRIAALDYEDARASIAEYCETVFFDANPDREESNTEPKASFIASLTDRFASEYGWLPDDVLDLPMGQVLQLLRLIQLRHDPKAAVGNRMTDRVVANLFNMLNPPKPTNE
jgi:hypothetical protein